MEEKHAWKIYDLKEIIDVALGNKPAEIVLKNANIVNVFSGEIENGDVAIQSGLIVGIGKYKGEKTYNLKNKYVVPGFIDAHVHIESSMVTPFEFSRAVVPLGTTSVIIDPHEIANVLGLEGITYIMKSSRTLPLDIYLMFPSCVPATHLETNGANLDALDLQPFLNEDWILGLAEMMNFPGVINGVQEVLDKIKYAQGKKIDGHAPGLRGNQLNAYISAGISTDHECFQLDEAQEKLRKGMKIQIREGSTAKNLDTLIPILNQYTVSQCMFATDDRNLLDITREGHINYLVKRAIEQGVDPVTAIRAASRSAAEHYGLKKKGAIAPGYIADLLILSDLENIRVEKVFKAGRLVAKSGKLLEISQGITSPPIRRAINVKWIEIEDFKIKAKGKQANVIGVIPNEIVTKHLVEPIPSENGNAIADIDNDILKIIVIERHNASGNIGRGFVKGIGIQDGAMASSIAHDSHNIVVVGTNDDDMMNAAVKIVKMQGGIAISRGGEIVDSLPLPIAGLMSDQKYEFVRDKILSLKEHAHDMGTKLEDPFLAMSFLSLPVIPELKLTDKGLVQVSKFDFIDLFIH